VILNIYKPKGWTSFDVVAKLRGILKTKKIGHTGTLDPLAEGVLVIMTDSDTKKQETLMHSTQKEYVAEIALGAETETYDMEFVPKLTDKPLSVESIKRKLPKIIFRFMGEIEQLVPVYSAKKVNGKTLYKEARKGTIDALDIPKQTVSIYEFEILDITLKEVITVTGKTNLPIVKCRISCSSGTYIRSIAHDLGTALDTGGVLLTLLRTRVGNFHVKDSVKIDELEKKFKN
jgi:tRNA pseudouridine55 synthase